DIAAAPIGIDAESVTRISVGSTEKNVLRRRDAGFDPGFQGHGSLGINIETARRGRRDRNAVIDSIEIKAPSDSSCDLLATDPDAVSGTVVGVTGAVLHLWRGASGI